MSLKKLPPIELVKTLTDADNAIIADAQKNNKPWPRQYAVMPVGLEWLEDEEDEFNQFIEERRAVEKAQLKIKP